MEITLELHTRYNERQKEKGIHQEKKPPVTGSNSFRSPQDSSSKKPHHKKNNKGNNFQVSKDKPHASLLNKDNKSIFSEKGRSIKEASCTYYLGNPQLKNASKGLRIGLGHQKASLEKTEKPYWES
ncbi:hypothetical protein O181_005328 [Austropuccinia psidii MF-1]|uniref:Uncharacterized protein n=1 Tax=Austropuccinia psidii MF-1 TaxID=1389203 RepID=A0A9Q3BIB0_9BASI|nr:hypothetical protein [Austropuccinia psidii MF-1]